MASTTEYSVEKVAAHHVEETLGHGAIIEAKQAADDEHSQTLWQALKANRTAVGWSVMVSMSVVMEGYDTILIGNFYGYPMFKKKYGHWAGTKDGYQISAPWQTGLGMASTVGAIFGMSLISTICNSTCVQCPREPRECTWLTHSRVGGIMNGQLCAKYGYRWVMIIALFFMAAFVFIVFFAQNLPTLVRYLHQTSYASFRKAEHASYMLTLTSSWSVKFSVVSPGEYLPQLGQPTLPR